MKETTKLCRHHRADNRISAWAYLFIEIEQNMVIQMQACSAMCIPKKTRHHSQIFALLIKSDVIKEGCRLKGKMMMMIYFLYSATSNYALGAFNC